MASPHPSPTDTSYHLPETVTRDNDQVSARIPEAITREHYDPAGVPRRGDTILPETSPEARARELLTRRRAALYQNSNSLATGTPNDVAMYMPGFQPDRTELLPIELRAHYLKEEVARQGFMLGLQLLRTNEPDVYARFSAHLVNAAVISRADVRSYDVAMWYGKGLPYYVLVPLRDLSSYYHKEVRLQGDLAEAERRPVESWGSEVCPRHDTKTDQSYAYRREKSGKAPYGFESTSAGYSEFTPRFEAREQLKWILAGLEARLIRREFADLENRHGKLTWQADRNFDRKVWSWIDQAANHLRVKTEAVGSGSSAAQQAMSAFRLTPAEKQGVYDVLLQRIRSARDAIKARRTDVEELKRRRAIFRRAEIDLEIKDLNQNIDNGEKATKVRGLLDAVDIQIELMELRYGDRKTWDWELGEEQAEAEGNGGDADEGTS